MHSKLWLVLGTCAALLLAGCAGSFNLGSTRFVAGSGRVATDSRAVSNFNAVDLAGFGELTITQGDTESLTIEAEDNLLPLITTEVQNGTLRIGGERGVVPNPTKPIRYDLKVKNLNAVTISGAGNVLSDGLKGEALTLTSSGAGNLDFKNLSGTDLTMTISGAGTVQLAGQVTSQNVSLSGLGSYRAPDLKSNTARVSLSGAGSAVVWAQDSLDASISGAGSIEYYGSPKVTQKINGVGSVKPLGTK